MAGPSNHIRMQTVSGTCPAPEALAAFVDHGSSAAEHVQVEAHLAACDDCRLLVARILETQSAVQGADAAGWLPVRAGEPRRVAAFSRKRVMWGTASLVAAAAVLALAVNVGIDPSAHWRSLRAGSKLADLAAAVGDERTIEARLTGGFRYGPLRAAVRSGGSSAARDHWTLYAAAGRIREVADRDPSAPNLHALGLAHLVLGQYDEAVRALEDAVSEDPDQPRYQSDLSAAYLARARQLDRPDDLPRALGAAERAVKGDERLLEARFNRALALEALFLEDQARQAWEDYLARDSSSGWANDARAHLQKLQKQAVPPPQGSDNSPPVITDTTVEAGLDWLLRHGLPAWAEAILANDNDRAVRERVAVSEYARQLSEVSGDSYAASLIRVTEQDGTARAGATAVQSLGRGLLKLDGDDVAAAEEDLRAACVDPLPALTSLCDVELGMMEVAFRNDAGAQRRALRAREAARVEGHKYVSGRVHRLDGYRLMFLGDYAGASASYRAAIEEFERARYGRQAANLASQLGELYDLIGLTVDAWRWRIRALQVAAHGSVTQKFATRFSAAAFLSRVGEYDAARAFLPLPEDPTFASISPLRRVDAALERAKAELMDADVRSARERIAAASQTVASSQDFRAGRLRGNVLATEGAVLRAEGKLVEAQRAFDMAVDAFGPERAVYRASALLESAGVRVALRSNLERAEGSVQSAIELLAARAVSGVPIQLDDAKTAFEAVASLVSVQPTLRTTSGLFLVERLRELLHGVPASVQLKTRDALDRAIQLPPDTVAYDFVLRDDSLLTWVIRAGDVQFVERPIGTRRIQRLAALLEVQIARAAAAQTWKTTLSDLYDLLLRDLPAINAATNIVIVADGPLVRIPFGALRDSSRNQFLFERAAVRIAPNLAFATGSPAVSSVIGSASRLLSIGEPAIRGGDAGGLQRLKHAREEAVAVARFYQVASVLVGDRATKAAVLAKLPASDIVHFAGHAVAGSSVDNARLLLAGSVYDPSNALTVRDLAGRVNRSRIVLAACETAVDPGARASGVMSIAATFLRSGAASVIGTLWQVDDAAGEQIFLEVHRALATGQSSSEAVARAQRACYASDQCRAAPSTWIGAAAYGAE
jgi:CHAT domain-containing protein